MNFSVIVPAYREKNLEELVDRILNQKLENHMKLEKIVIVACECGDIRLIENDKLMIIEEEKRMGKAFSINTALKDISSDIVLLESSDTLPHKDTIQHLLEPFKDSKVGMTVSKPVPKNNRREFIGFVVNIIWSLHHKISTKHPKGGEMIAFRNVISEDIPKKLATDESYIEFMIKKLGYEILYVPSAIVYNSGPSSISNLIKQRRRIFNGHLHIKEEYGYSVSTMDPFPILKEVVNLFKTETSMKKRIWIIGAVMIETWSRTLASIDFYILKKIPYKWEMVK